jgi:voltage-gated potassium channel
LKRLHELTENPLWFARLPEELLMNRLHRWAEAGVQVVIVYSLIVLFLDLELGDHVSWQRFFEVSEWVIGVVFTVEYLVRWAVSRRWWYPLRPVAVIDLLAVLPFYLWLVGGSEALRVARILRVVRVLKLDRQGEASATLYRAYYRIRHEIRLTALGGLVVGLCGTVLLFELERDVQPEVFARVSDAAWCILATVTTVGYGDKVPRTDAGRLVAGVVMLSGLVLFGTFVSLVGGSFVEEIRRKRIERERHAHHVRTGAEEHFDAHAVVLAIHSGVIPPGDSPAHQHTVDLLERACRIMIASQAHHYEHTS